MKVYDHVDIIIKMKNPTRKEIFYLWLGLMCANKDISTQIYFLTHSLFKQSAKYNQIQLLVYI